MSKIRRVIDRMRAGEDLGLDRSSQKGRQRAVNPDGSYNLDRRTGRLLGNFYLYHWLLTSSWTRYWLTVFGFYSVMNVIFATIYYLIGPDQLYGVSDGSHLNQFIHCFFFSAQSFTTVGYGSMYPLSKISNMVATLEAFTGLMTFALATGNFYGRFSKPVSRIKYSKNILIAPYNGGTGLQFMVANEMSSSLMEMEARVSMRWVEDDGNGNTATKFALVNLQIDKISLFPISWVINHPIDEDSALYGRTMEEIEKMDMEIFILLKGFDDVFSQTIYSRQSYTSEQFIYGAKFRRPWEINERGVVVMDLTKVGEYDLVKLPVPELAG